MTRKTMNISYRGDGWVSVEGARLLPWRTLVQVASVDGRPCIVGLQLHAPEGELLEGTAVRDLVVTAEALRRLPLRELRDAALAGQHRELNAVVRALEAPEKPPGQRSWDDSHYERVAEVYRAADGVGRPPRQVIADRWHVGLPTVSRWLREARRRGHLAEYRRGQGQRRQGEDSQ